ncbi:hypothetical protein ACVI1L_004464 [Bradyrhizobium sp. USDA 4516]
MVENDFCQFGDKDLVGFGAIGAGAKLAFGFDPEVIGLGAGFQLLGWRTPCVSN